MRQPRPRNAGCVPPGNYVGLVRSNPRATRPVVVHSVTVDLGALNHVRGTCVSTEGVKCPVPDFGPTAGGDAGQAQVS